MIIESLSNAKKYVSIHPLFAQAFEYIYSHELEEIGPGEYVIDGDKLKADFPHTGGMSTEEAIYNFGCHDKHIDIQPCIKGKKKIGWKPRGMCTQQKEEHNVEGDVVFYSDTPDMYFQLTMICMHP
jgi:biofilm protein TabA